MHAVIASATTWVIEMHHGADNRLTDVFLTQALKPALDTVERHWRENWRAGVAKKDEKLTHGAVILVGNRKQDKFFSNGTCVLRRGAMATHPRARGARIYLQVSTGRVRRRILRSRRTSSPVRTLPLRTMRHVGVLIRT